MAWGMVGRIVIMLLGWIINRSAKKEKAEKQFARIVKEMDRMATRNSELKLKYDAIKKDLAARAEEPAPGSSTPQTPRPN